VDRAANETSGGQIVIEDAAQPAVSQFLVTKPSAPKDRRRKEPEISWEYTPRIEPGEYRGYFRAANVYWDRAFKRWVFAAWFVVFGSSLVEPLACLTWYLNLGSREKPKANRRSKYWAAEVNANGGPPKGMASYPIVFSGDGTQL
jgi:hypothetical protein